VYRVYRSGARCPLSAGAAGILGLTVGLLCSYFSVYISFAVLFFPLLLWALAERPTGFLGGQVAQYGGRISYCLYMTHGALQILFSRVLPTEHFANSTLPVRLGVFVVYWIVIGAAAISAYHFVEVPARRWLLTALEPKASVTRLRQESVASITEV
jgi:peptidoglycan/LPS O-acetylase OafA/YrhL